MPTLQVSLPEQILSSLIRMGEAQATSGSVVASRILARAVTDKKIAKLLDLPQL